MTKIKINNTELFYTEYGSGTPFLTMHGGLGLDHSYLRPVLDPLADIFHLIYYDFRGHGRSGKPPINTITYEQLAEDAEALRKELDLKTIGVIGNSAGGYVALNYAIKYPDNLKYLILIDTAPAFDYMGEMMELVKQKKPTPEMIKTFNAPVAPTPDEFKKQFKILQPLYFYNYTPEFEEMAIKLMDKVIFTPEAAALNDVLTPKFNVCSQLSEIKAITLILVGEDDFICPPSQAKRMHEAIPNSDLHIFEKSGHYPFFEDPDNFYEVIRNWFEKVS